MSGEPADRLLAYIDAAPSPYHAVAEARAMLVAAGFVELAEGDSWDEAGSACFVVRDGKTIVAWRAGTRPPAETGVRVIAAHSDSPVLKLRPNPVVRERGTVWIKPDIYGSPLLHSWLDRDLKLAGAVFHAEGSAVRRSLVALPDLRVRAVSLAPHLKKEDRTTGVRIDVEKDLLVALGQREGEPVALLHEAVADAAGIAPAAIVALDLSLGDVAPCARIGAAGEFLSAPRLDNLFSSWCALRALIEQDGESEWARVVAIYDAEEIGSQTFAGARSDLLDSVIVRLARGGAEDVFRTRSRSLLASLDMAHAEHPAFRDATDPAHVPQINGGVALKAGARGNYAVGPAASAWFEHACRSADVPLQRFMYRCDHGGGSSVGPILSTAAGITGFDLGAPLMGMHSIRELGGAADVGHTLRALDLFLSADGPQG